MDSLIDSSPRRSDYPDPESHAANIYDEHPLRSSDVDEDDDDDDNDDDDIDFEPEGSESESIEFFETEGNDDEDEDVLAENQDQDDMEFHGVNVLPLQDPHVHRDSLFFLRRRRRIRWPPDRGLPQ